MDVVGLQAFDRDQGELLLDLLRCAMGAGGLFLGGPDEELEIFPASGAMEVEERHEGPLLIGTHGPLPIRKTPPGDTP